MKINTLLFLFIAFSLSAVAQPTESPPETSDLKLTGVVELGFLGVADHNIQFSQSGTNFDYRRHGGQDVLFPVSRLSLELEYNQKNTVYFLYQPLRL